MTLERRVDALEQRLDARDNGPRPVWVIFCEDGIPRELLLPWGWRTEDGECTIKLAEGQSPDDVIAEYERTREALC